MNGFFIMQNSISDPECVFMFLNVFFLSAQEVFRSDHLPIALSLSEKRMSVSIDKRKCVQCFNHDFDC